METNYKNWVPKGMIIGLLVATIAFFICFLVFGIMDIGLNNLLQLIFFGIFLIAFIISCACTIWCIVAYKAFSYTGKRQLSKQIVSGISEYVSIPDGGKGLDVGCGSGALTIACAKRNPKASMTGIDRWGKEYASFNKILCENNAIAENISNINFIQGDATNLNIEDESFDTVTSNYVYHNIVGANKQKLLLETLRVLKKGGTFAIHDLMTPQKYGDMTKFVQTLKNMGYEKVALIETTNNIFMTKKESKYLMLEGSMLLTGIK